MIVAIKIAREGVGETSKDWKAKKDSAQKWPHFMGTVGTKGLC